MFHEQHRNGSRPLSAAALAFGRRRLRQRRQQQQQLERLERSASTTTRRQEPARSRCCCRRPRRRATSPRTARSSRRKVKALCPDCKIIYSNADQDAAKQQQQAEAALTQGAKVLVLDPVDAASAAAIVDEGQGAERPGHQLRPPDHRTRPSTTTSRSTTSRSASCRATALVEQAQAGRQGDGPDRDDQRRADGQQRQAVQAGRARASSTAAASRSPRSTTRRTGAPDKAQNEMEQAITALGNDGFDGVYAANDGTAGGAIAAMKSAGIKPTRPTTGQDAELGRHPADPRRRAVHDRLQGDQAGGRGARRSIAVALAKGEAARRAGQRARPTTARRRSRR